MAVGGWLIMPSFENCDLAEFSLFAEYVIWIKLISIHLILGACH